PGFRVVLLRSRLNPPTGGEQKPASLRRSAAPDTSARLSPSDASVRRLHPPSPSPRTASPPYSPAHASVRKRHEGGHPVTSLVRSSPAVPVRRHGRQSRCPPRATMLPLFSSHRAHRAGVVLADAHAAAADDLPVQSVSGCLSAQPFPYSPVPA